MNEKQTKRQMISISIVTPNKAKIVAETDFAVARLDEGEIGFLINHTPLIGKITYGFVRFNSKYVAVENGILDFSRNVFTVICQNAAIGDSYKEALENLKEEKENHLRKAKQKLVDFTVAERDLARSLKKAKLGKFVRS